MNKTELLHVADFPTALHDRVAETIATHSVGLVGIDLRNGSEVDIQSGSGTLVELGGALCIVTADHVVESILGRTRISLLVDWTGGLRRCAFDVDHLRFVRLPRGSLPENGPDLAAIVLPTNGDATATLRAFKTFYNLDKRIATFSGLYPDVGEGFWFPCGVLGEGSQQVSPTRDFSKVTGYWGLCAVAARPTEFMLDNFDYLDLRANCGVGQDLPGTFGGMSGGGLWQARIGKNVQKVLYVQELIFSGVIFWESAVVEGMRTLRSHGRASVHERLPEAMHA